MHSWKARIPGLILSILCLCPGLAAQETAPPELGSRAAVLLDIATGAVLYSKNPDLEIPPASLAKLMTMHLVLEELAAGRALLDEIVALPPESWAVNQPPRSSLMFLNAGQEVTLRELLLGLAIPSGNDAAVAVALRFAPSVEAFAELMNQEAQALGLSRTRFVEPSGVSEYNLTTALEYAFFCREYVLRHPGALTEYHTLPEFAYPKPENVAARYREQPGTILQYNTNDLLGRVAGLDGLKTGYIDESGYNIALTAEREGTRFVAVLLGAGDRSMRNADGQALLEWAFANYHTVRARVAAPEPAPVWKGALDTTELVPAEGELLRGAGESPAYAFVYTAYANRGYQLGYTIELDDPLVAPLAAGTPVGALVFQDSRGEFRRVPLVTAAEVPQGSFFKRFWDSIRLFFRGIFKEKQ